MKAQDLTNAPTSRLKKYCCKKCGGRLDQIYDQTSGYRVVCTNRCSPLEVETMSGRQTRTQLNQFAAEEVELNYPELAPKRMSKETFERSQKALFGEE
jgi:hypothetical protein